MNVEALEHLIEVLEKVPRKKFSLGNWYKHRAREKPLNIVIPDNFIKVDCKSSACAFGWFALDKRARRKYKLGVHRIGWLTHEGRIISWHSSTYELGAEIFGITYDQSRSLFSPECYRMPNAKITPLKVVRKIKNLIKEGS